MVLESHLEQLLLDSLKGDKINIEPGLSETLLFKTKETIEKQKLMNAPIVLLVPHALRFFLSRFLRIHFSELTVLSQLEITELNNIKVTNIIGSS